MTTTIVNGHDGQDGPDRWRQERWTLQALLLVLLWGTAVVLVLHAESVKSGAVWLEASLAVGVLLISTAALLLATGAQARAGIDRAASLGHLVGGATLAAFVHHGDIGHTVRAAVIGAALALAYWVVVRAAAVIWRRRRHLQ